MRILLLLFSIGLSLVSCAQMDTIKLRNSSFEGPPSPGGISTWGSSRGISTWYDCGRINFPEESAPDIHPLNIWGVKTEPYDGKTYLGLVVRDNDTWESISQKLTDEDGVLTPMLAENCYRLSMTVAQSEEYISGSRLQSIRKGDNKQKYNYTTPAVVRLWGGDSFCNMKELLATSNAVVNSDWETIEMNFVTKQNCRFITIEAFYEIPVLAPYNGHVLIDNLSDIIQVACKN